MVVKALIVRRKKMFISKNNPLIKKVNCEYEGVFYDLMKIKLNGTRWLNCPLFAGLGGW